MNYDNLDKNDLLARISELEKKLNYYENLDISSSLTDTALRELSIKHNDFFDVSPLLISEVDINGRYLYANKATADLFNLSVSEIAGKSFQDLLTKETSALFLERIKKVQNLKKSIAVDDEIEVNNDTRYYLTTLFPLLDDSGEVSSIGTIAQDITDKNLAEKKNLDIKLFYEKIIEVVQDGIWVTDENHVIYYANAAIENIVGISRELIQGKNILTDFPEETTQALIPYYNRAMKLKKPVWHDIHVKTPSGRDIWQNGWLIPKYENDLFKGIICIIRDETERKKAEIDNIKDKETAERYLDMAGSMFVSLDSKGNIILVNQKGLEILEYESSKELIGRNWFDVCISQKHNPGVREVFNKIVNGDIENFEHYENEIITKNGNIRLISWYNSIIYDDNDNPLFLLSSGIDVTEIRHADSVIKENEERFRKLLDSMNSGVAIYKVINDGGSGSDYIIQDFNRCALELENMKKDQVIGKSLKEIRPQVDNYGLIDVFQKVWKTKKPAFYPAKVYIDDNFSNFYENRIFSISDDEIVAIYDDVTERENATAKILNSQERFNLAMKASRDGLFDWNLLTNEFYYSPGWKSMLGYEYDEIPNDFSIWETLTEPCDVKRSWKMLDDLKSQKIDRFEIEFKMKHKDGHWVDILSRAEGVFDENNKATRIIGTHVDISELKLFEQELAASERKYRSLIETASDPIYCFSEKGIIVDTNQAACNMLEKSREEIIKSSINSIEPSLNVESFLIKWSKIPFNESRIIETEHLKKDGKLIPVEISIKKYKLDGKTLYYSIARDITARKKAESLLKNSLTEKEILLRELYHRTKNNMQVISSMLGLRAMSINSPQLTEIFKDIENKILSMALVHKKLYESGDLSHIDLKEYMIELVTKLKESLTDTSSKTKVSVTGDKILVLFDIAVPFGIIVNEIITNSLKYAFENTTNPRIDVTIHQISAD